MHHVYLTYPTLTLYTLNDLNEPMFHQSHAIPHLHVVEYHMPLLIQPTPHRDTATPLWRQGYNPADINILLLVQSVFFIQWPPTMVVISMLTGDAVTTLMCHKAQLHLVNHFDNLFRLWCFIGKLQSAWPFLSIVTELDLYINLKQHVYLLLFVFCVLLLLWNKLPHWGQIKVLIDWLIDWLTA